jgi:hypothetical protein
MVEHIHIGSSDTEMLREIENKGSIKLTDYCLYPTSANGFSKVLIFNTFIFKGTV